MKHNLVKLFIVFMFFYSSRSVSQNVDYQFPTYQRVINMAMIPLFAIPLVHEGGHGLFAWIAGADSITIHPFAFLPFEKHSLNSDLPQYSLRSGFIFGGGALTTRLAAQLIHVLLNNTDPPPWAAGIGGGLSTMLRADLPVQYLWGLTYAIFSPSKGLPDFTGLTQNLFDAPLLEAIFYIASAVIITADIYYSWNGITHDFNRAVGR